MGKVKTANMFSKSTIFVLRTMSYAIRWEMHSNRYVFKREKLYSGNPGLSTMLFLLNLAKWCSGDKRSHRSFVEIILLDDLQQLKCNKVNSVVRG